ncbi:MAG: hypothetical protein ACREBQ_11895, partial [Nitrososphaerales archaeon]
MTALKQMIPVLIGLACLVAFSFLPVSATISQIHYESVSSAVQTPTVSLTSGIAGASTILSPGDSDATNISASLAYYENTNPPTTATTCSPPSTDTTLSSPVTSGNIVLNKGYSACLWSPQYSSSSLIASGFWTSDLWMSARSNGYSLLVSVYLTDSTGAIVATIMTNQNTNTISTTKSEILNQFSGVSGVVPANGYIEMVITAPSAGSRNFHLFWGVGQLSSFSTPSTYDYILVIANVSSATSWQASLSSTSSMISATARLVNLTIWVHSSLTSQISIGTSVTQNLQGATISIAPSSSVYIAVYALASTQGYSSVNMSLRIQSPSAVFSQYTI